MATPDHYRSEAARCRELAAKSTDAAATRRWLQLALDYEQLARSLSGGAEDAHSAQVPMPDNQQST